MDNLELALNYIVDWIDQFHQKRRFFANIFASAYKGYSYELYEYFKEIIKKADFGQLVLARKAINKNILRG